MPPDQDSNWKRYELLVREIFQLLMNQNEVQNVDVKHNVTLQGKTAGHQVDVYWEFEKAGITYRTVVQAKDWATAVVQGELIKFKGVLDDLPKQPRGVFVTRTGYQDGAREYARAHGITLYELNEEPTGPPEPNITVTTLGWIVWKVEVRCPDIPADIAGPGKKEAAIRVNAMVFQPRLSNMTLELDRASLRENPSTRDIDVSSLIFNPLPLSEAGLYDDQQKRVSNLEAILREELEAIRNENVTKKRIVHTFDRPTFLGPETTNLGYIKIDKVIGDVEVETTHRTGRFKNFVELVLHETLEGTSRTFIKRREQ